MKKTSKRIEGSSTRETKLESTKKNRNNRLFFHIPFHPKDVSRQQIRNIYEGTCESDKEIDSFFTDQEKIWTKMIQIHK